MKKKAVMILTLFCATILFGQKIKVTKGDYNFFKGQKNINVEFVYDNMKLLKKNLTNEQYMTEHAAGLEEKAKGKGKTWKKSWIASRELIYAPKFLELMNRILYEDHGVYFEEGLSDT
ncbi:hypothetical protein [Polaribacter sp.]|uniref:hypothetical protein n=1 Tax=Polaribacter sp. TaxID=1920175 RepID=UPI003EF8AABC